MGSTVLFVRMSGSIVHSLVVDRTTAVCGFPWCAPGRQPTVQKETHGVAGLEKVLEKFDKICTATGCPSLPLSALVPIVVGLTVTLCLVFLTEKEYWGPYMWMPWVYIIIYITCSMNIFNSRA